MEGQAGESRQPLAGLPGGLRRGRKRLAGSAFRDGSEADGGKAAAEAVGDTGETMKAAEAVQRRRIEETKGLACPRCGCRHLHVVYTPAKPGHILPFRSCRHCGRRLITRARVS